MIEIELPDGSIAEFPDGTPEATIENALKQQYSAAPANPASLSGPRSFAHGFADMASFGFADEAAAGIGSLAGMLPGGHGKGYSELLGELEEQAAAEAEMHPYADMAGRVTGALSNAAGIVRGGLSLGANLARGGASLPKVAVGSSVDGAIVGALSGAGEPGSLEDRATNAAIGVPTGAAIGMATPVVAAGAAEILRPLYSPLMAYMRPGHYAKLALGEKMRQGGTTVDDVVQALTEAQASGQPMMVADAMGHAGQRLMSTVTRNPNDARQLVVEALESRQSGQGRRLASFLTEAFDAPDTAAQRATQMTKLRATEAAKNYGAARAQAGPVDITPVVTAIDKVLTPGVHSFARPNNNIAHDSIEGALQRVRNMITDGKSNITDFNAVFRAKLDLDDMIARADAQGAGNRAHYLSQVQKTLDETLAKASGPYAHARDVFAADSKAIEAIDVGRKAAQRGRPQDTVATFRAMTPDEQYGFRGGYVDPLIESVQSTAPGVNKARALLHDAMMTELPEFAMPGHGPRLVDRIRRENLMTETANTALRGSHTADNLADAASMAQFDPTMLTALMSGQGIIKSLGVGLGRAINAGRGNPVSPSVLEKVGRALMETQPAAAREMMSQSAETRAAQEARRQVIEALMRQTLTPEAARLLTAR